MIARLRGKPVANTPEGLVLDVAGVGYLVHATPTAVRKGDPADEITVETYLHVREDVLQLYGFADRSERELFVQLLAVNGIGPKVALAIVSGSPVAEGAGEQHVVARDALVELGWSLLDAERALAEVDPDMPPEERVRLSLKKAA